MACFCIIVRLSFDVCIIINVSRFSWSLTADDSALRYILAGVITGVCVIIFIIIAIIIFICCRRSANRCSGK